MDVDGSVIHASIFSTFDDVLLKGGALGVSVTVEFEQAFGQVAVAHVLLFEQEVDDRGKIASFHVVSKVGMCALHAGFKVVEESESTNFLDKFLDSGMLLLYFVVDAEIGGSKGIKVFEHARCSTGGGHELENFLAFGSLAVVCRVFVYLFVVESEYAAIVDGGGVDKFSFGKSLAEVLYLLVYSIFSEAEVGDLA